ncbi:cyanase [Pseudomonas aeruginosa]|uniref:cyanase n=1 Tax=Pseudomonas aeruginosa TaxID=287 RepID=UPI000BA9BB0E|nr:hypothetical protein [Pseudomonas aeruginosa]PAP68029.1 hypothetical protein CJ023_31115 [Pseudomonas aeruginosa]
MQHSQVSPNARQQLAETVVLNKARLGLSWQDLISAINSKLDIQKVEDPEGGPRAVITLDGKYLPTKPF